MTVIFHSMVVLAAVNASETPPWSIHTTTQQHKIYTKCSWLCDDTALHTSYPYKNATSATLRQRIARWHMQFQDPSPFYIHLPDMQYFSHAAEAGIGAGGDPYAQNQGFEPYIYSTELDKVFEDRRLQHVIPCQMCPDKLIGSVVIVSADTRLPQWQAPFAEEDVVSRAAHANAAYAAAHGYDFDFNLITPQAVRNTSFGGSVHGE